MLTSEVQKSAAAFVSQHDQARAICPWRTIASKPGAFTGQANEFHKDDHFLASIEPKTLAESKMTAALRQPLILAPDNHTQFLKAKLAQVPVLSKFTGALGGCFQGSSQLTADSDYNFYLRNNTLANNSINKCLDFNKDVARAMAQDFVNHIRHHEFLTHEDLILKNYTADDYSLVHTKSYANKCFMRYFDQMRQSVFNVMDIHRFWNYRNAVQTEVERMVGQEIARPLETSTKFPECARFPKSVAGQDYQRLPATQIRTKSQEIYALYNTPNPAQALKIVQTIGRKLPHGVLGQGSAGKVRVAEHLKTGELVAVKKIRSEKISCYELNAARAIQPAPHLMQLLDYSVTTSTQHDLFKKSYLMFELGSTDAAHTVFDLIFKYASNKANALASFYSLITQCVQGVAELHAQGYAHRDVKPSNFFQVGDTLKLGDFTTCTAALNPIEPIPLDSFGTQGFHAPEKFKPHFTNLPVKERMIALDNFALGMTLKKMHAVMLNGRGANGKKDIVRLQINQQTQALAHSNSELLGTQNSTQYAGNTFDEVIARLIDENPKNRLTATHALQLPFFNRGYVAGSIR